MPAHQRQTHVLLGGLWLAFWNTRDRAWASKDAEHCCKSSFHGVGVFLEIV